MSTAHQQKSFIKLSSSNVALSSLTTSHSRILTSILFSDLRSASLSDFFVALVEHFLGLFLPCWSVLLLLETALPRNLLVGFSSSLLSLELFLWTELSCSPVSVALFLASASLLAFPVVFFFSWAAFVWAVGFSVGSPC